MTLSVSGVNLAKPVSSLNTVNQISFRAKNDNKSSLTDDSVEISKPELTTTDKQKILKKARQKAAGYAVFGGIFSTAYYGLRSNNKIARKYNLDPVKDKDFIKQIKKEQTIWTLAGALLPAAGGIIAYIVAANKNSKNIEIDE